MHHGLSAVLALPGSETHFYKQPMVDTLLTCSGTYFKETFMFRKLILTGAFVLALLVGVLSFAAFPRSHAAAAPAPVTYGDIQAILHAGFTAGQDAILVHAHQALGAPVEDYSRAAIDFFTPVPPHFCVDDWHLLRLTAINDVDGVFFFTKEQAIADLQQTTVTFTMDGASVSTIQTPITKLNADDQRLFGLPGPAVLFTTGSIFSPGALGVGPHQAEFSIDDPTFGFFQTYEDFVVDASQTGACLQG
jgi:hypothetical protein